MYRHPSSIWGIAAAIYHGESSPVVIALWTGVGVGIGTGGTAASSVPLQSYLRDIWCKVVISHLPNSKHCPTQGRWQHAVWPIITGNSNNGLGCMGPCEPMLNPFSNALSVYLPS